MMAVHGVFLVTHTVMRTKWKPHNHQLKLCTHPNTSAREMLKGARRKAANPDMQEGSMDDFMNRMGLGDPDPSNHKTGFQSADEIVDWFQRDKPDDWRQRD